MNFAAEFDRGRSYRDFLEKHGTEEHRRRWAGVYEQISLTDDQRSLLKSFKREMRVLVVAGAWCGDCVNQCPIFARIEEQNSIIKIRYFDRDADAELAKELSICGAPRVPSLLFLSEDGFQCGRAGDRTLSRYREIAGKQLGPSCPTGVGAPAKTALENWVQDWLDEFERIQLMLRTSSRLRQLHGD